MAYQTHTTSGINALFRIQLVRASGSPKATQNHSHPFGHQRLGRDPGFDKGRSNRHLIKCI